MTIGNGGRRIVHAPRLVPVLGLALLAAWALPGQDAQAKGRSSRNWKKLAKTLAKATKLEQKADYLLALGRASLLEDEEDRDQAHRNQGNDQRVLHQSLRGLVAPEALPDCRHTATLA